MEGVKRGVPASPVRGLGANVLKGARLQARRTEEWSESAKAAAEAVLPEFKSKAHKCQNALISRKS